MHPHFDTLNLECFQHSVSEGSLSHTRDIHIAKQERVRPGSAWESTSLIPSNLLYIDFSNSHSTMTHIPGSNIDWWASLWTVPSPPPLDYKCEGVERTLRQSWVRSKKLGVCCERERERELDRWTEMKVVEVVEWIRACCSSSSFHNGYGGLIVNIITIYIYIYMDQQPP